MGEEMNAFYCSASYDPLFMSGDAPKTHPHADLSASKYHPSREASRPIVPAGVTGGKGRAHPSPHAPLTGVSGGLKKRTSPSVPLFSRTVDEDPADAHDPFKERAYRYANGAESINNNTAATMKDDRVSRVASRGQRDVSPPPRPPLERCNFTSDLHYGVYIDSLKERPPELYR